MYMCIDGCALNPDIWYVVVYMCIMWYTVCGVCLGVYVSIYLSLFQQDNMSPETLVFIIAAIHYGFELVQHPA